MYYKHLLKYSVDKKLVEQLNMKNAISQRFALITMSDSLHENVNLLVCRVVWKSLKKS